MPAGESGASGAETVSRPLGTGEANGAGEQGASEDSFAAAVGRNIARARERVGLSQEELGVRASLHRTAVGQLERGERVARSDTLVKIAGSLDLEPGELLEGLKWSPGGTVQGSFAPAVERHSAAAG